MFCFIINYLNPKKWLLLLPKPNDRKSKAQPPPRLCFLYGDVFYAKKIRVPEQDYGFVEKMEPLAISARLFIFRMSLTHSAKSSG